MGKLIDLTGQRFGRLTVIERANNYISPKGEPKARWICLCDCGNVAEVNGNDLRKGHTKSCGCLNIESAISNLAGVSITHGKSYTRLYKIWSNMKTRCCNPQNKDYAKYGGRGIAICEEWLCKFQAFYDWAMSNGYQDDLSIDRIDNEKGYSPENCRWASRLAQVENRRNTRKVTINGVQKPISEWCRQYSVNYETVISRIYKCNWTPEEAFGLVPRKKS